MAFPLDNQGRTTTSTGLRGTEAQRRNYDRLRHAVGPLALSDAENRLLHWLATWDQTDTLESLFLRLRGVSK